MRFIRAGGLCVAAVVALLALSAACALASPEYFICAKEKGAGRYEDKGCSTVASPGPGNYERVAWTHAKKRSYKGEGEGIVAVSAVNAFGPNLQEGEPGKVEGTTTCAKEKVVGEVTGRRRRPSE